ncbi:MAG: hypothetical protein KDK99_00120 [Verrucomicrobiales bacterium]|nr:hypothetical protein [Verrucomicrobiales bacterium]
MSPPSPSLTSSASSGHTCPVCGYPHLREEPRHRDGGGSYEICPACGFQFGVDDDDRGVDFASWRQNWVGRGMPWSSRGIPQPQDWDPAALIATLPPTAKNAGLDEAI